MKIKQILKSIGIGFIGGLLGAYGGAKDTNKLWRRLGIPIFITVIALIMLKHCLVLSIMSLFPVLTIGYGIPDINDSGSPLGRFWYKFFIRHTTVDAFTRGTVAFLSCLTLLSIPLLKSNWIMYIIGSIVTIAVYASLSWRSLGHITIFGKNLIWSEIIPYTALTTFVMFLIF